MLSVFPGILFLAPFSALLIRVALAFVFFSAAGKHRTKTELSLRVLAGIELAVSVSVLAGAWTQVGALAGGVLAIVWLIRPVIRPVSFIATLLTLVLCLSLILTGAGPLAFDLPL